MSRRRSTTVLRGVASLIAAVALLVGVPIALASLVGWPLPTTVPDGDTLSQALRTGISDDFVVNTLAVIAWLAWGQLALAMGAETVGVLRGQQPLRLPVAPGLQGLATRLVAGIVLLVTPLQPARAVANPPVPVVAEAAHSPVVHADGLPSQTAHGSAPAASPVRAPAAGPTVTVQRHDSYWAVAERTLGDGLRWREIHAMNVGRTMSDGHTITSGDETLRAGWPLLLPADAAVVAEPEAAVEVVVESGDNLWDLSEERLSSDLERDPSDIEVVPYWRDVIDANEDRLVERGNPSLILPGQVLVLPPTDQAALSPPVVESVPPPSTPGEAPPTPAPSAPTTTTTASTTAPATTVAPTTVAPTTLTPSSTAVGVAGLDSNDGEAPAADEDGPEVSLPWAVGGLSSIALAVGLKRLIDRRRRRFTLDNRRATPTATPVDQQELHHAVVAKADEDSVDGLQAVLGKLANDLVASDARCRPRIVQQSRGSIEVLLDGPAQLMSTDWKVDGDGTVLTIDTPIRLDALEDGPLCPAPLLVTIGQPEDDSQLYLDLEADGIIAMAGDADAIRKLARSILTELALAPLADTLRVMVVGDLVTPEVGNLDHLTLAASWAEIADDVTSWAEQSHGALVENGWANAFVGRGHEPDHDALIPVAVVATEPPPPAVLESLRSRCPSAVAVVVAEDFDGAAARIRCAPDVFVVEDVGLQGSPQAVDSDELEAMARLLVTGGPEEEPDIDLRQDGDETTGDCSLTHQTQIPSDRPIDDDPPEYDVLVRLLGDIRVDGGKPLNPKPTAVMAYLAVHREVTPDRIEEACWFSANGSSRRKRLLDVMTECRDALGSQHLPANRSGTYRMGDRVRTDLELFDWYVERASHEEPDEAILCYRSALGFVTGKPFSYPNSARASFGWVDYEHYATTWELRIAGVAQACAELHLDLGDAEGAISLLREILHAVPMNGAVVEALMRAHLANGDRPAADRVYQEHRKALEQAQLGDPDDSIEQLCLELRSS